MPKKAAILQYLVPFFDDSYQDEVEILSVDEDIEIDRDAVDDIEQIIKDAAVDKDDWASIQNMESAIRVLESSTAKIHNNSDLERKQIIETNRFEYLQAICIVRYLQKRLQGNPCCSSSLQSSIGFIQVTVHNTLGNLLSKNEANMQICLINLKLESCFHVLFCFFV